MTVEVRYVVDEVDAAAGFYLTHLGFTEAEDWGAPFGCSLGEISASG